MTGRSTCKEGRELSSPASGACCAYEINSTDEEAGVGMITETSCHDSETLLLRITTCCVVSFALYEVITEWIREIFGRA